MKEIVELNERGQEKYRRNCDGTWLHRTYDWRGNEIYSVSSDGQREWNIYDANGSLCYRKSTSKSLNYEEWYDDNKSEFRRDYHKNLPELVPENKVGKDINDYRLLNHRGQVIKNHSPSGCVRVFLYDYKGQLTKIRTDDKAIICFVYDNDGNLIKFYDTKGNKWRGTYDRKGICIDSKYSKNS